LANLTARISQAMDNYNGTVSFFLSFFALWSIYPLNFMRYDTSLTCLSFSLWLAIDQYAIRNLYRLGWYPFHHGTPGWTTRIWSKGGHNRIELTIGLRRCLYPNTLVFSLHALRTTLFSSWSILYPSPNQI
jgi:hypothetical protein